VKANPSTVNIVTMGCSKNTVDSEKLSGILAANNWKVFFDDENSSHNAVIINTCGFINDAKRESIDMILKFAEEKKRGKTGKLYVMGCLSQRYGKELKSEIPEVEGYFGVTDWEGIASALGIKYKKEYTEERIVSTPSHYAYLKISEGCSRTCSFCIIPEIRGRHVSAPMDELVQEAQLLADKGVKELILIAQDLTYYGVDLHKKPLLANLVQKISEIQGIEWIRLHYAFPSLFPSNILEVMRENPSVCRYIDMPLQHCSDGVLKKMRRGTGQANITSLINKIRKEVPGVAVRTTLLVGHPGESEKEFEQLKQFVRDMKFDRLGVFTYSHEENTLSGENYPDTVPPEEKERRANEIMSIQQQISQSLNAQKTGKTFRVIIDREESDHYAGRTEFDSPEVDPEVIIKKPGKLVPGNFYYVKIDSASEFDLYGSVINEDL